MISNKKKIAIPIEANARVFKHFICMITCAMQATLLNHLFRTINVPKQKLPAIAELIVRINCNLDLGNFDIDMDDSLIVFRTGIIANRMEFESETHYLLVSGNSIIMDRYFPTIVSIAYGNVAPKKAIQLLHDVKDECTQEREENSVEEEPPSKKRFNWRMGFFSDN